MSTRDWLIGPVIHVVAWLGAYQATVAVLGGTSGVAAYGMLSGWWLALYADYVTGVKLKAGLVLFGAYFALSVGTALLGLSWFHTDTADDVGLMLPLLAAGQAAVFVSLLILNSLTRKIVTRLGFATRMTTSS